MNHDEMGSAQIMHGRKENTNFCQKRDVKRPHGKRTDIWKDILHSTGAMQRPPLPKTQTLKIQRTLVS
jgi:hypothetical protein